MTDSTNTPTEPVADDLGEQFSNNSDSATESPSLLLNLSLPDDPDSQEFSEKIMALRAMFSSREAFNFMVCDELAKRGQTPNGRTVLNVGHWGNSAAVTSDVKQWYASLSKRLSAQHANIPEAARLQSNALFEQMWALAIKSASEPAQVEILRLRTELQGSIDANKESSASLNGIIEEARIKISQLTEELSKSDHSLESASSRISDMSMEIDTLQRSIAQAAVERTQSERDLNNRINTLLEQAVRDAATAKETHEAIVRGIEGSHKEAIRRLEETLTKEQDRNRESLKSHALAIDQFRQDVKAANERADKANTEAGQARALTDSVKDQLANANIEAARANQKIVQLQELNSLAEQKIKEIESEKVGLTAKVAELSTVIGKSPKSKS